MLYVDIPTLPEFRALVAIRADACISIYVSTPPQTQHVTASRIAFGNLTKAALEQLDAAFGTRVTTDTPVNTAQPLLRRRASIRSFLASALSL